MRGKGIRKDAKQLHTKKCTSASTLNHPEPPSPRNEIEARSQCLSISPRTAPHISLTGLSLDCGTKILNSENTDQLFSTLSI
jgi:hypothetical protein